MPPVRFYCLWCHIKKKKKLQTKLDCFKPITRHSFSLMFTLTLNLRFNRFNCYFPNERFGYEMRHQGGRARSFGSPECFRMVACYHCKKPPPQKPPKKITREERGGCKMAAHDAATRRWCRCWWCNALCKMPPRSPPPPKKKIIWVEAELMIFFFFCQREYKCTQK